MGMCVIAKSNHLQRVKEVNCKTTESYSLTVWQLFKWINQELCDTQLTNLSIIIRKVFGTLICRIKVFWTAN